MNIVKDACGLPLHVGDRVAYLYRPGWAINTGVIEDISGKYVKVRICAFTCENKLPKTLYKLAKE